MRTNFRPSMLLLAALTCAGLAQAQQAPPPTPSRTVLDRHDQSGVAGKEIVLGTAQLPAGTVIGWHIHHGDESGCVLKGTLILKTRGRPDQVLKAGDRFFNPQGAVHSLMAAPDGDGGVAL